MKDTILVFCAHSDDEVIGLGGTLLQYIDKGCKVIKVIFSAGEKSHPHYRPEVIVKKRIQETSNINKKYGVYKTIYFQLKDGKLKQEIEEHKIEKKIKKIITQYNPKRIFTLSALDPHMDHRAVHNAVVDVVRVMKKRYDVYAYEVWNVVPEKHPVFYVDIGNYFSKKIKMMKEFKSQWLYMYTLLLPVYFRAKLYGFKNNMKYAEKFYKIL